MPNPLENPKLLTAIHQSLSLMVTPTQAARELSKKHKVSERTAWRYIKLVHKEWSRQANDPEGIAIRQERHRCAAEYCFRIAMEKGKIDTALKALKLLVDMDSNPVVTVKHEGQVGLNMGVLVVPGMLPQADEQPVIDVKPVLELEGE